jgi:hypothetical protein
VDTSGKLEIRLQVRPADLFLFLGEIHELAFLLETQVGGAIGKHLAERAVETDSRQFGLFRGLRIVDLEPHEDQNPLLAIANILGLCTN